MDDLKAKYAQAPDIIGPILQQAINRSPDVLAKYTVRPQVPYVSGQLIETFQREVQGLTAYWFPTVKYAPFVEFGTGPHVIYPKNKKALFWPGAAHPVKKVNHPGTRPNPFMERILDAAKDEINATFKEALNVSIDALSSK